jgi:hypothetical protein
LKRIVILDSFKFNVAGDIHFRFIFFLNIDFSPDASNATRNIEQIIIEESSQEAHETSEVPTEVYDSESVEIKTENVKFIEKPHMEIASRIIWTTPRAVTTETRKTAIKKETITRQRTPWKENGAKHRDFGISEYKEDSSRLSSTTISHNESGESTCSGFNGI